MRGTYLHYSAVFLTLFSLLLVTPVLANNGHGCEHDSTIQSLRDCVVHADEAGHIDNSGITKSLLAKLDAAQSALNNGQSAAAVNLLDAFVNAVEAQKGKHIIEEHAAHMIMHAQQVIEALSPS